MSASLFVACAFVAVFYCGVIVGSTWTAHGYSKRARRQGRGTARPE